MQASTHVRNSASKSCRSDAVLDRPRAMRMPGESFGYEFAAEPPLLHRRLCYIVRDSMVANNLVFRRAR
jgi:hypothetical protein